MQQIEALLIVRSEDEHLEFKVAQSRYDFEELLHYCVALANEGGGRMVLGITDKPPRRVVGTRAFDVPERTVAGIHERIRLKVSFDEVLHPDGRVLIFNVPGRARGQPLDCDGRYFMRAGGALVPMSPDQLRRIFAEGQPDWLTQPAKIGVAADEVIALLDTQAYFDLMKLPYPTSRDGVLERLESENLVVKVQEGWTIPNLTAILLAKRLDSFSPELARKAPRVVIYEGVSKLNTREDKPGSRGYAAGFEGLVDFVHSAAPRNRFIEQAVREEVKMFPKQALRELIANALVHQDFTATGASVMIEMYDDRVEISNPGLPPIKVERFIDEYRSRNEKLADLMRRWGICEEKGSGVDKVVSAAEVYQLPAPDFRLGEFRTTAVIFVHQEFPEMSKADRIRACYQHCCLQYVSGKRMSNQSLRERFGVSESKSATVSLIIGAAKDAELIRTDDSETASTRYARYLPFWA
ncbi:MAG: putative DNA binding domain-containing protein [Burkholderiales bacterium]|nr:putative DNA binding domain-containing protein [Burkholderiales bacterium]MCW5603074.1 putative DNA binding domain-containing protein [Burkholderiales bacterium]